MPSCLDVGKHQADDTSSDYSEYKRIHDRPATGVVHVGRSRQSLHAHLLTAYLRLRNCTARSLLLIDEVRYLSAD